MGLLGSGSRGRTRNPKIGGISLQKNLLNHALDEPSGRAAELRNSAISGKMLHNQLRKDGQKGTSSDETELPVNLTVPTISGTAQDGQTLTASSKGTWRVGATASKTTYAYQWLRDGAVRAGETASTYVVVTADV